MPYHQIQKVVVKWSGSDYPSSNPTEVFNCSVVEKKENKQKRPWLLGCNPKFLHCVHLNKFLTFVGPVFSLGKLLLRYGTGVPIRYSTNTIEYCGSF